MTNEEIVATIKVSFKPLRVAAEVWDYDAKLKVRIFGADDKPIVQLPGLVLDDLRDGQLPVVIDAVKRVLAEKGIKLTL